MFAPDINLNFGWGDTHNNTDNFLIRAHIFKIFFKSFGKSHFFDRFRFCLQCHLLYRLCFLCQYFLSSTSSFWGFLLCRLLENCFFQSSIFLKLPFGFVWFVIQYVGHGFKYLLYYAGRSRSSCGNANGIKAK